jgi:hypothetical protein
MEVHIIKDMMGVAQNNKLKFHGPHEHPHFREKVHMSNIFL